MIVGYRPGNIVRVNENNIGRLPQFQENVPLSRVSHLNYRTLWLACNLKAEQLYQIKGQGVFRHDFAKIILAVQIDMFPGKGGWKGSRIDPILLESLDNFCTSRRSLNSFYKWIDGLTFTGHMFLAVCPIKVSQIVPSLCFYSINYAH